MSYELLVITGHPRPDAAEARRRALAHAATAVPGCVSSTVHESPTVSAAVVATQPHGGTLAGHARTAAGTRLTLATNDRGLSAAGGPAVGGAETGHVTVLLGHDGRVELGTDGMGFLPCYWGPVAGGIVISTHLATLVSLGLSPEPDERGLVEYMALHHPLGTRTLLRHAQLLPAGGRLQWQPGDGPRTSATPIFMPADEALPDREVLAAFAETWPLVVSDALRGPQDAALGLSGGLDSRAIAETAVRAGARPLTYTYGTPPSHEPVAAARVATALGLPHVQIPVVPADMLSGDSGMIDLLDGAHSPSEMYELWFAPTLRSLTRTVVNGLAGGALWGDEKSLGLTDPAAVLQRQWKRHAAGARIAFHFLSDQLGQEAELLLRDSFVESFAGWDFRAREDMVVYWRLANRQTRWGTMLTNALRRSGLRVEAPFLDSRFLTLAARLSPAQRRNGNLYLRVHRELFPRTARIPRSDDGNPPRALDHVYWSAESSYLRQLAGLTRRYPISGARRAIRHGGHVSRAVLRERVGVSGPADRSDARRSVFPADFWLRTQEVYADRLCTLLELGDHPLISSDAVAAQVRAIRAGTPTAPALVLGRVAAARTWLSSYERRAAARQLVRT